MLFLAAAALSAPPPRCTDGTTSDNVDFAGHCCYTGQVWSGTACIGIPTACPPGRKVDATNQTCAASPCLEGQVATPAGPCCWPGQAWSTTLGTCKGLPTCPAGTHAYLEQCLAPGAPPEGMATFTSDGDGGAVSLEAGGRRYVPGEPVPPGLYKIRADFGGTSSVVAGEVDLRAGDTPMLTCSAVFRACRAAPAGG